MHSQILASTRTLSHTSVLESIRDAIEVVTQEIAQLTPDLETCGLAQFDL
jgi:hypothetical protein